MASVTIGGVTLDLDPENYMLPSGQRRGSVHRLIDGNTLIQDRGMHTGDMIIQMSGRTASAVIVQALFALYVTGGEITLTDWMDNAFTVVFAPGIESFHAEPIRGSARGYTYTMQFCVTAVSAWFGGVGSFPGD